jgi:uncharacterized phage protein gp47/JayE
MSYQAPYIDPVAGLVIPSYADILAYRISQYQAIYPQAVYLGTETPKYQELSILSLMDSDVMQACQLACNARSPLTAVGSDLDSIVKLNGIARKAATYSTAPGLVSGVAGTVITGGLATDTAGNVWALPTPVTIPNSGSVVVPLTCQTLGAITAITGAINTRSGGLTAGWTGITNPSPASPGLPVETDSQLRARQSISVALPSETRLAGTLGAIAKTAGVTRYNRGQQSVADTGSSIENFSGAVDEWGNPAHSISMVVEGGTDLDVATAIALNRGIGPYTNGTTRVDVTDPTSGVVSSIGFTRPTYVDIYVTMQIHGLQGYTSAVIAAIQTAVALYLNSLQIGETVTYSSISAIAQSVMPSLLLPQFSITSYTTGTAPGPSGAANIAITQTQVARGTAAYVLVTEA